MHEHEHRAGAARTLGGENVDQVARVRPVFHVAQDLEPAIRLLLLQGCVDWRRLLGIDHAAERGDPLGDVGRHLR
jgi:hypothetical protein